MRLGIARWAAPVAIVLLAIALHWSLLDKGFVSDDLSQVLNNTYLRSPRSLGQIFSSHVWSFHGPEAKSNYYRPMMHLLYMACYGLFGLESAGFHAANLLFHAGCSLLVFYLGRALGAAWCAGPSALLAALLFAVHPVHTEAIAWLGRPPGSGGVARGCGSLGSGLSSCWRPSSTRSGWSEPTISPSAISICLRWVSAGLWQRSFGRVLSPASFFC